MSTRPVRLLACSAAVTAALLVAGCSGGDEPPAPTSAVSEDVATGSDAGPSTAAGDEASSPSAAPDLEQVHSDDDAFTLDLPLGWTDAADEVEEKVEVAVRANEMTDDFYSNIVIAGEAPDGGLSLEEVAEQVAGQGGSTYEMLPEIEVAGETAPGFTLTRRVRGVAVTQTQRWIVHDDRRYVATLSSAKGQAPAATAVFEQVLESWSWSG